MGLALRLLTKVTVTGVVVHVLGIIFSGVFGAPMMSMWDHLVINSSVAVHSVEGTCHPVRRFNAVL